MRKKNISKSKGKVFYSHLILIKAEWSPRGALMVDGRWLYSRACNEEHRKYKERKVGGGMGGRGGYYGNQGVVSAWQNSNSERTANTVVQTAVVWKTGHKF